MSWRTCLSRQLKFPSTIATWASSKLALCKLCISITSWTTRSDLLDGLGEAISFTTPRMARLSTLSSSNRNSWIRLKHPKAEKECGMFPTSCDSGSIITVRIDNAVIAWEAENDSLPLSFAAIAYAPNVMASVRLTLQLAVRKAVRKLCRARNSGKEHTYAIRVNGYPAVVYAYCQLLVSLQRNEVPEPVRQAQHLYSFH